MRSTTRSLATLGALAALGGLPLLAHGATLAYHCGMAHFVRSGGNEIVATTISIRNADPVHAASVLRLTVRDGDGKVVHDSGPLAGAPLPLNTDFPISVPGGKDIGTVPPDGAVYLRSNHLWGNAPLPGVAGSETGQLMSATVVVAKEGPKATLSVRTTTRIRARFAGQGPGGFAEGDTRATGNDDCTALHDAK